MKHKTLHLIPRLPIGGAERLLASVLPLLSKDRFESIVCCIEDKGAVAEEIEANGYEVICLGLMKKHGFDKAVVPALTALIKARGVSLVHTHLYHANMYGRLAALRAGVPVVATVHNRYTRTKFHRRLLNAYLGYKTARVIAVSDQVAADVMKYDFLPKRKVMTLCNGVNLQRYATPVAREEAREKIGFPNDQLLIAVVGRLEEQKGHKYLFQAVASMPPFSAEDKTQIHLLVVGDGRLREELQCLAKDLGISERVHFLGMRQDVPDILHACDIFAMPSLWEGMSIAMLEAMAAGMPIVATDVGAARQVLQLPDQYAGLLVKEGDAEAFAAGLRQLVDSRALREQFAQKARQHVSSSYCLHSVVAKLEDLYRDVLQKTKRPL